MTITTTERRTLLGYPSRPTGGIIGTELPDDFKLLSGEIATPKLDGHRVLMDLASGRYSTDTRNPTHTWMRTIGSKYGII